MLSSAQLERMRADVARMLPDTAVITGGTVVSDGGGGWSTDYQPVAGGTVACRLDPLNQTAAKVAIMDSRETLSTPYQLTVPYDAPLAEDYQVTIDNRTYDIVQLDDMHSWNVSRRATVVEVR